MIWRRSMISVGRRLRHWSHTAVHDWEKKRSCFSECNERKCLRSVYWSCKVCCEHQELVAMLDIWNSAGKRNKQESKINSGDEQHTEWEFSQKDKQKCWLKSVFADFSGLVLFRQTLEKIKQIYIMFLIIDHTEEMHRNIKIWNNALLRLIKY